MAQVKMKSALSIIFSLILASSFASAQPSEDGKSFRETPKPISATEQLDAEVEKAASAATPGVAVLVLKNGELKYRSFRGLADLDSKTPISGDTRFYIASLGKQFTAVSIMMLADRGKLSYSDKLVKYLPGFSSFAGDITIHHLLTHTSGLVDHLDVVKDDVKDWTNGDVVALLKRENRVLFAPGEKVSYSNSAYVLLSMIVEKVSGESFPAFLKRNIFDPLRMKNTSVAVKGVEIPQRVRGYAQVDGKWRLADHDAFTTGGGGIYSTLDDMEKWDRSFSEKPLIKPETLKLASTANRLNNGKPTAYGYGWLAEFAAKGDLANVWYVASYGNFKGFQAMQKRIPDRRYSVIVLTNSGRFPWNVLEKAQELYAK